MLMQAISMTASDLSASTKPWDIQVQTVKVIFEEFYLQGDAERAAGRQPIAMMDRTQPDQQALSQVSMICVHKLDVNLTLLMFAFFPGWFPHWHLYSVLHITVSLDTGNQTIARYVSGEFDQMAINRR